MRCLALKCMLAGVLCLGFTTFREPHVCNDWGFFGHKKINELAVFTLPQEMFGFYKDHIEYLIEHSVDPDKRRYGVVGEAECHYNDMDRYMTLQEPNPFKNVPRRWKDAVDKYSEDTLIVRNAVIALNDSGLAMIRPSDIDNGSFDNCSLTLA